MRNFYSDFEERPRRSSFKSALLGGAVGALLTAVLLFFFMGVFGAILNNEDAPDAPAPEIGVGEDNVQQAPEVSPEAREYYEAVVAAASDAKPSVVGISNYAAVQDIWGERRMQERAAGSGVIIDSDGYIVTNYHVIQNAQEIVVTLGTGEEITAEVVGADPPTDLAVLRVDKDDLPAIELSDSDELSAGEPAIAIGNPLGLEFQQTVTLGVVSAPERSVNIQGQQFTFVQTDAAINEGNSGGALVNIDGKVIGINTAKITLPGVEGMGFAIPSNTVQEITSELIQEGRVIRPWMGVYISNFTPLDAERMNIDLDYGVLVEDLVSGGPAQQAGMEVQDVIIRMDGERIEDVAALQQKLLEMEAGQEIEVTVNRAGEEIALTLILDKMPEELEY